MGCFCGGTRTGTASAPDSGPSSRLLLQAGAILGGQAQRPPRQSCSAHLRCAVSCPGLHVSQAAQRFGGSAPATTFRNRLGAARCTRPRAAACARTVCKAAQPCTHTPRLARTTPVAAQSRCDFGSSLRLPGPIPPQQKAAAACPAHSQFSLSICTLCAPSSPIAKMVQMAARSALKAFFPVDVIPVGVGACSNLISGRISSLTRAGGVGMQRFGPSGSRAPRVGGVGLQLVSPRPSAAPYVCKESVGHGCMAVSPALGVHAPNPPLTLRRCADSPLHTRTLAGGHPRGGRRRPLQLDDDPHHRGRPRRPLHRARGH